jgi:hypothetical protein
MTDLPEDVRQKISSAFAWVDGEIATVKAEIAACECHLALLERIRQGHRVAERHFPDCNRTRLKAELLKKGIEATFREGVNHSLGDKDWIVLSFKGISEEVR